MADRSRPRLRQDATRQFPFADHSGSVAAALYEPTAPSDTTLRSTASAAVLQRKQQRAKEEREKFRQIQHELSSRHAKPHLSHITKHSSAARERPWRHRRRPANTAAEPMQDVLKLVDRLAADPFIRQLLPSDCAAEYMIQPDNHGGNQVLPKENIQAQDREREVNPLLEVEPDDTETIASSYSTQSNWLGTGARPPS